MLWFRHRKTKTRADDTAPSGPADARHPDAFLRLDAVIREGIPESLWKGEFPRPASDAPQQESAPSAEAASPPMAGAAPPPPPNVQAELEKRLEALLPRLCDDLTHKIEAHLRPKIQAAVHEELGQALHILLHVSEERIRDRTLAAVHAELAAEIRACLDSELSNILKPQNSSDA